MPKNRDYTGLMRTPSSMAWLIRERAKLKGQIERLEKQQSEMPERLNSLKDSLKAIDAVFPLHEVSVDPVSITGKRKKDKSLTSYGAMTRAIYEFLRESKDLGPCYTTEIAMAVIRKCNIPLDSNSKPRIIQNVRVRLKGLHHKGDIIRHHDIVNGSNQEGRWSLPV